MEADTIRSNAIPHSLETQWKGKHFASRPPSWRTLLRRTQQVAPSEHVHAPSARASSLHRVSSQRRRPVCNPQLRPTAPEQRWINLHKVPAKQNLLALKLAPAEGSMDGFGGPGKAMRIAEMGSIGGRGPGPSLTRTSRAGSWATLSANRSH
ncbi:hypothetical protein CFAM422_004663 [Trichoderma lentiforme]|uniref:Uncharacterized protein n=1 Tax=Trichoderma lentiforme TaxID=1567552 RepID=A0A9P5CG72_9HYPO|nr:hypothetical protein CFAM422_004663 [Trichoderma lentiforme]